VVYRPVLLQVANQVPWSIVALENSDLVQRPFAASPPPLLKVGAHTCTSGGGSSLTS
jgi:hypothetical protein